MIRNHYKYLNPSKLQNYFAKFARYKNSSTKPLSTNEKFNFELSKNVEEDFLQDKFATRDHPGIMRVPCVQLPSVLLESIERVREESNYPESSLNTDAQNLIAHIFKRKSPAEEGELQETITQITDTLIRKGKLTSNFMEGDGMVSIESMTKEQRMLFNSSLKTHVYNWHPLEFNDYSSFTYLWGRLAPDYAALIRIFSEIRKRRIDFVPRTLFDFGSGVGSVTWAADSTWPKRIQEVYNVDSSISMMRLSEKLQRGGNDNNPLLNRPNTTYFRQFLPTSEGVKYDLVVSSRTLFEIGNLKERVKTADILWRKVAPGGFLVFVETGSLSAYSMIIEIRDYLLEVSKLEREKYELESPIHVFAPCSHDEFCPRFHHRAKTSCHFSVMYNSLSKNVVHTEKFSYVVLQKENRNGEEEKWPRIVEPVLRKHHHVITRTCTPEGTIKEFVTTKSKHGSRCYLLCKKCKWGDFLPINIKNDTRNVIDETDMSNHDFDETSDTENKEGNLVDQEKVLSS